MIFREGAACRQATKKKNLTISLLGKLSILCCLQLALSCAKEGNVFDCEEKTANVPCESAEPLEKARQHLNNSEPDQALELLINYREAHSDDYSYYPLISSAYAMKAGLDIFNIVNIAGGDSSGIFDVMKTFLPDPATMEADAYQLALQDMNSAKSTLESMPEEQRTDIETYSYAASAMLQLTLYTSAYAVMFLNQFVVPDFTDPSSIDLDQLQSMSAEDAAVILQSLAAALAANPDSPVSAQIQSTLDTINAEEGGDSREQLINFIQKSQQP